MANYQLNAGDSVVVTITDTDNVTGVEVVPDTGSVTAVLSSATDTIVVDPSGAFATITANSAISTSNTVTVNGTVGGVASKAFVGTYDVIGVAATGNATTLSGTFGTETGPTGTTTPLTAAQLSALSAAGLSFTAFPLTAAQLIALSAAGVPASSVTVASGAPAIDYGPGAGQINPLTGLVNP